MKKRKAISKTLRLEVVSRAGKKCEQCFEKPSKKSFDIHHIDENPANNSLENLTYLCRMCHVKAHGKMLYNPDEIADKAETLFQEEKGLREIGNMLNIGYET